MGPLPKYSELASGPPFHPCWPVLWCPNRKFTLETLFKCRRIETNAFTCQGLKVTCNNGVKRASLVVWMAKTASQFPFGPQCVTFGLFTRRPDN